MITHSNTPRFWYILGLLGLLLCSGASGQSDEVTLDAELSRARVYIGDAVTYQVIVRGASDGTPPEVEFPEGVVAEYRGASSQQFTTMRSVNGQQRTFTDSYFKHQYLLTIVKDGSISIPSASLKQGPNSFTSNPVTMTALLPGFAENDIIELKLPSRAIYAGESAVVEVTWWVASSTQSLSFETSQFPDSIHVTPASPRGMSGQEHPLKLFGQQFTAYSDRGIYQGQPMTRLRFDLVLTPTLPGRFDFGPVRVVFTRQDDFARASRMYAESDSESVHVIKVPTDGKPDGYRGLIGSYQAQTDASNSQVNVGDPIEFRLLVSGPEPMIGLEQTLGVQSLETDGFRVSPDGWREVERRRSGERLFTTTIRATNDSITQIPAIRLPAFNPETGAFEVFESEPIPLDVRPVRTVTLSDAVTSGFETSFEGDIERAELAKNPSQLWAHPDASGIRASTRSFSLWNVFKEPGWIVGIACICGVPLLSWTARGISHKNDPRAAAIEHAWKQAKRLHSRGDDVGAIRVYGGAILEIEPESLTGADLKHLDVSEDVVTRSASVLAESESMQFGSLPGGQSDDSLLRAMRRDIRLHGSHQSKRRAQR